MAETSDLTAEPVAQATRKGCLLCGSADLAEARSISAGELRQAWQAIGISLSDRAWLPLEVSENVVLFRCRACGFEFCDPSLAGNEEFYRELQAQTPNYYPTDSLEFGRAVDFAVKHQVRTVLDVGCGAGAFLNLAKRAELETYGVELNRKAAEISRAAGHHVYDVLISELIAREKQRFDLVTTWQVLEHVSDPLAFLSECAELARPGGYVAVAVPFEDGAQRLAPWNPHMWPPHHISRWRRADVEQIGRRAGLTPIKIAVDPLHAGFARHIWTIHNQLAPVLHKKPHAGGHWLPALLALAYSKLGCRHYLPGLGPSVYAFYCKSA